MVYREDYYPGGVYPLPTRVVYTRSHTRVGVSHAPYRVGVSHAPLPGWVCHTCTRVGVSHALVGVSHAPLGVSLLGFKPVLSLFPRPATRSGA